MWSLMNFSTGAIFFTSMHPTQSIPLTGKAALNACFLRADDVPESCESDSPSEYALHAPWPPPKAA